MPFFRRISQNDKAQPSLFFDAWANNDLVTDDFNPEYPKVLYHGTTHGFNAFDPQSPHLSPEGFWGKGFYFSDDYQDVNTNYATFDSPDATNKMENMAERIVANENFSSFDLDKYKKSHPQFFDQNGNITDEYELAKVIASEKTFGAGPQVMPVYLKMKNPLNTTEENPTVFDIHYEYDEYGDPIGEPSGNFFDLKDAVIDTANDYGLNGDEFWESMEHFLAIKAYDGYLTANDVVQTLKEQDMLYYLDSDENGNNMASEFIKAIFQRLGYDGVIMSAWQHFGGDKNAMRGINPDTKHYITWEPTNIKSAIGNNGLYDPENPIITANMHLDSEKIVKYASYLDLQERFCEADEMDLKILRISKSLNGVNAKADKISRKFLGMYTIHNISGSSPRAAVLVYRRER